MTASGTAQLFERIFAALESGDREGALDAIREGYELFNRHGVSAWLDVFDPDIEWSEGADVPEPEVYRGREGVLRQQQRFEEAWESFRIEPEDFAAASGRLVVIVGLWGRGRGSGAEVRARAAHLWEFRDDRVVRFHIYGDPEAALRAVELPR